MEIDDEAKILNAVCAIDVWHTLCSQEYHAFFDLKSLFKKNKKLKLPPLNKKAKEKIREIISQMEEIYNKWHNNPKFMELLLKINNPKKRDDVWALKFKKEQQVLSYLSKSRTL